MWISSRSLLTTLMVSMVLLGCQTGTQLSEPVTEQTDVPKTPAQIEQEKAANKAAEEARKKQQALNEQAIITAKAGDVDLAIELFESLIKMNPDYPYVQTNLALQLLMKGNIIGARALFRQAIDKNGEDAIAHNHLALILRKDGKFEQALEHYQRALDIDEDYANAHLNTGILLDIYLQRLSEAEQHYQRYLELTTDDDSSQQMRERVEKWIADLQRRVE